jgi:exosortase A-associated hydrolase 2
MLPTFKPSFQTVNDGPHGQRFCIHHPPALATPLGLVVHVHPFAEEMNKSRRMAAQQARALAAAGFAVLQIDLLGCGDSAGDSSDATWAAWLADVVWAARQRFWELGGSKMGDAMGIKAPVEEEV